MLAGIVMWSVVGGFIVQVLVQQVANTGASSSGFSEKLAFVIVIMSGVVVIRLTLDGFSDCPYVEVGLRVYSLLLVSTALPFA